MDADYSTPASKYFDDLSLVVKESTDGSRDNAILWLSFWEIDGYVNLGVYSDFERAYTHQFKGSNPAQVNGFLKTVEKDYGVKIPKQYYKTTTTFLELAPQSFGLSTRLSENTESCETCGDFGDDEVQAFYFPAIPGVGEASLAVNMTYGCYGHESAMGLFSDEGTFDQALQILNNAAEGTDVPGSREEIHDFIARLNEIKQS